MANVDLLESSSVYFERQVQVCPVAGYFPIVNYGAEVFNFNSINIMNRLRRLGYRRFDRILPSVRRFANQLYYFFNSQAYSSFP